MSTIGIEFKNIKEREFTGNKLEREIYEWSSVWAFFMPILAFFLLPLMILSTNPLATVLWYALVASIIMAIISSVYHHMKYIKTIDVSVSKYIEKNKKSLDGFHEFIKKASNEELIEFSKLLEESGSKIELINDELRLRKLKLISNK